MDFSPVARLSRRCLQAFQRAPRERRTPSKREAQRIEKLEAKMQAMGSPRFQCNK